ncbi:type IV secretion system protein [Arsenophonus nasoniae]|uniref:Type IV secretion system protein n=1 Tax=Arsenophonus nasoniae TaxID=638 RepID=A0AA95K2F5_9GAMM|nr:type IV secretion system protein [Arsenophonus nasoniae]WGL94065.1 type IV secretion system protein [Arsenophonus nasoniae]
MADSTGFEKGANFEIAQPMFDELSRLIKESVASNFQSIMQMIAPLFGACMVLYVVFLAWEIMYSEKNNIMMESIKTLAVFAIVCTLMTVGGMYLTSIVPFVQSSGQEIAGKIIGTDGQTTGKTIDTLINSLIDIGYHQYKTFKDTKGMLDSMSALITFIAKAVILLVSGLGFVVVCASYLLLSEMMVGILLSIGGVFIAFAAFPATRQMFTAWVGSCLNYIFLNIAYACLFKIMLDYINANVKVDKANSIWGVISVALIFIIAKFLLAQISTLVSTLTGGVGINGLTSAVGNFNKSMMNTMGLGQGGAARGALGKAGKSLMQNGLVGTTKNAASAVKNWRNSNGNIKGG